ncbi:MAG TPA: TonB-dependent receptor, partial [Burkholderiaceae bacterium]|nr:TonB-dependent receptor [Burkholderiaceae bacterium]
VYAHIGRGFETPTLAELAYRTGATGPNLLLRAPRARHAEVGSKWRLGPTSRVELALFRIDTDDELVVESNVSGRTTFRNAGRTRREGVELAIQARLAPDWHAYAAASTLRATFRDDVAGPAALASGNRLPGVPDRLAYGEIAWRPAAATGWGTPEIAVELMHAGRIAVNDANSEFAEPHTRASLRAGVSQRFGDWRVGMLARLENLTDRRHVGSVIVNDANSRFYEPGPGRGWLIAASVSYHFR